MRVFIAGASGVIGRRLVPMLVDAGHEVTGMTRREERLAAIADQGAEPVRCDAFDAERLAETVADAKPDVVVDELTQLPPAVNPRRYREEMAGNVRIQREGTANLLAAAVGAGARRLVAESIAFGYQPEGAELKTEASPLYTDAPDPMGETIRAFAELERLVHGSIDIEGVVLRYGYFYGPGSAYAGDGAVADKVRRRRFPVVGKGDGVWSFVHVDDAASATMAALERGVPGIYNIVDDEPARMSEWLPAFAEAVGAKEPASVPLWLARAAGGGRLVTLMTRARGASNQKAKRELGWEPRYPSWRTGFREGLG